MSVGIALSSPDQIQVQRQTVIVSSVAAFNGVGRLLPLTSTTTIVVSPVALTVTGATEPAPANFEPLALDWIGSGSLPGLATRIETLVFLASVWLVAVFVPMNDEGPVPGHCP